MTRSTRFAAALLALALSASSTRAQDNRQPVGAPAVPEPAPTPPQPVADAPTRAASVPVAEPAGPTVARAAVGVRADPALRAGPPSPAPRHADTNRNEAMMIVGGAALIIGAVIGNTAGTLLMVGGTVLGLFGLYNYLE